ncbi:MAG: alpha/beta fold hydrolase [Gracilimonas sp.]|uniref:alpha/beta fold hydrolase n=1 Tax=Gracilimonas sp. TaxID=1974203 RepID=UPI0037514DC8|nr:alpha/beta fold hydrolase [Gracilimonas sp.]
MKNYLPAILFLILFITGFRCAKNNNEENFEKLIPVNKTELFVKVVGEGEPMVVLHGGPGLSHDYFLPHLYPLAEEIKLVLFDQRGMGRSSVDLDSVSFSLDLLVEDIEALRKELDLGKIHLLEVI